MSEIDSSRMIKDKPDYDEIFGAVEKQRGRINDYTDAISFLQELNINKDNNLRFISYLVTFGIIDDENTRTDKLYQKFQDYDKLINEEFGENLSDPLSFLQNKKTAFVIKADIDRSIGMFNRMAEQLNLSEFNVKFVHLHAMRILALLSLKYQEFSYTQGFDRYILSCYLLAVDFSSQNCLPPTFAEAITYYLAPMFLRLANIHRYIDNLGNTTRHFENIDKIVSKKYPELSMQLERNGHGSIHYALRWELLMFVDEYDAKGLFLIWDSVVVNRNNYDKYILNLCIAHVLQIPAPKPGEILIEKIQTYRDWNPQKAIRTAYALMAEESTVRVTNKYYALYASVVIVFLTVLYFFMK